MAEIIELSDDRVENFDHDTTAITTAALIAGRINQAFSDRSALSLLDVGGGNGTFLDAMLLAMPRDSFGTIVEMSGPMVERNTTSERKCVIHANFLDWAASVDAAQRFDVIFFNFVLHHFVGKRRAESIRLQTRALNAAKALLSVGGLIVVYEIHYNGLFQHELPSKLIHLFTSSAALAPIVRRLGANTAGYGVCFHSETYWRTLFATSELRVVSEHCIVQGSFNGLNLRIKQLLLNISTLEYKIHLLQFRDW